LDLFNELMSSPGWIVNSNCPKSAIYFAPAETWGRESDGADIAGLLVKSRRLAWLKDPK
jgi:hypothetical protein